MFHVFHSVKSQSIVDFRSAQPKITILYFNILPYVCNKNSSAHEGPASFFSKSGILAKYRYVCKRAKNIRSKSHMEFLWRRGLLGIPFIHRVTITSIAIDLDYVTPCLVSIVFVYIAWRKHSRKKINWLQGNSSTAERWQNTTIRKKNKIIEGGEVVKTKIAEHSFSVPSARHQFTNKTSELNKICKPTKTKRVIFLFSCGFLFRFKTCQLFSEPQKILLKWWRWYQNMTNFYKLPL